MKSSRTDIEGFLAQKQLAIAGYSRDTKKFGHVVYSTLREKGYTVFPVNPAGGMTPEGDAVYTDVASLPEHVQAILVVTKPDVTTSIVTQALEKGMSHFWIQQMSGNEEVMELLKKADTPVIYNRCILMHANPTGIHKFHRWLAGIFGRIPTNP